MEPPKRSSISSSSSASSREFEFWNPSAAPSTRILTADELFSGGVLLPLHLLSLSGRRSDQDLAIPPPPPPPSPPDPVRADSASIMSDPGSGGGGGGLSKRWKDIFTKVGEKTIAGEEINKEKRNERKAVAAAELKINIWPFARSRSARNGGGSRQRSAAAARKASSAPCSRSNSRGDTDDAPARKLAAVPGRSGVHVGRAIPVCKTKKPAVAVGNGGGGIRGLNLSVNSCIGYSGRMSCRGEDGDKVVVAGGDPILAGGGGGNGGVFGIKSFFSKKVY